MIIIINIIVTAYSYCRISRDGHDRHFQRFPRRCNRHRSVKASVLGLLSLVNHLIVADYVSDGHALERTGLDLLIDHLGVVIFVKSDLCKASSVFRPGFINPAHNLVSVVVIQDNSDRVEPVQIDSPIAVIEDLWPYPQLIIGLLA